MALALASPTTTAARAVLAIAPIAGDARGRLGDQLTGALCGELKCLQPAGSRRLLPARARRLGAAGTLLGSIWRERGGRVLSLALFTGAPKAVREWVLPLRRDGLLPPERLEQLASELGAALPRPSPGSRVALGEPEVRPDAPPAPAAELPPPPARPPPPLPPPVPLPPPPRPRAAPPVVAAPDLPSRSTTGPWLLLEGGVEPTRRTLRFPSGGTAPVGYAVDLPAAPHLRLELLPLRWLDGPAAGITLFADATWQPAIPLTAGTRSHRATLLRARGGLLWRLHLADALVVVPTLAYELDSFVVEADGAKAPGLPDSRLSGPSAGLDLEVPLGRSRLTLLAGGRAAWWLDSGDLAGGGAFFPGGRAFTLEAEAGADVSLAPRLSLRVLAGFARTDWTLEADPSGAYSVRSARAERWGGRVALRLGL